MKKKLTLLLLSLITMITVSSCGNDPDIYAGSGLVGSWQLVRVNGSPIIEQEVAQFDFWSNGSGTYAQYVNGIWCTYSMTWDIYGYDDLEVYISDGYMMGQTWSYQVISLSYTTMELRDMLNGNILTFISF